MIYCMVNFPHRNTNCFITFLHGYPQHHKQKEIWETLLNIKNVICGPWASIGDFNEIFAKYETKFTQLSHFASDLISIEKRKAFRFQEGLSLFFKDKLSFHKLETYSEVVESTLLVERSAKEFQRYTEQHKRGRSDYPQGVQT